MGIGLNPAQRSEETKLLSFGIENGLNFLDTAESYADGAAEKMIAEVVNGIRENVILASKFSPRNSSREAIIKSAESSLKRLNTDYIDLYQNHWPSCDTPFDETLAGMASLLESGKARAIGLSNPTRKQVELAEKELGADKFVSIQQQYNLADRQAERGSIAACSKAGRTFIAYSPLFRGEIRPRLPGKDETWRSLCDKYSCSSSELTIAWLLRKPNIALIPKASRKDHLLSNKRAESLDIESRDLTLIDSLYPFKITCLPASLIDPKLTPGIYASLEEAKTNHRDLRPSPVELSNQIKVDQISDPIKIRKAKLSQNYRYQIIEGQVRYWAWTIAFGDKARIPCLEV